MARGFFKTIYITSRQWFLSHSIIKLGGKEVEVKAENIWQFLPVRENLHAGIHTHT